MLLPLVSVLFGLPLLVWSSGRFVTGSAAIAKFSGVPPLVIGMLIMGFGTSVPELLISAQSSLAGTPGLALGNAYGSNITNIALILGIAALIKPIGVQSGVLRRELPLLAAVTLLSAWMLRNLDISRTDGLVLLGVFFITLTWSVLQGLRHPQDPVANEARGELPDEIHKPAVALMWCGIGLVFLIASSRALVWGAVEIARALEVSDLLIGLTLVALGTSLPELAATLAASRKGEDDLAVGNIVGSNLFNTLAVVGLAGAIHPLPIQPEVLQRDFVVMGILTLALFVFGIGRGGHGRINRWEGSAFLLIYAGYLVYLVLPQLG